jgi:acetoin utilization deacetylase AcuC-like enzyme
MSRKVGYFYNELTMWHDTGSYCGWFRAEVNPKAKLFHEPLQHFENAEAKRRAHSLLAASGVLGRLVQPDCSDALATDDDLLLYHTGEYISRVDSMSKAGGGEIGVCCAMGAGSHHIARIAVGLGLRAVDQVLDGTLQLAYVLCRPPGHHAEADHACGFCLFNNVALAALHARKRRGVPTVAIVDFDVHHGNGTEHAFYRDPNVLFISVHQDSLFPAAPSGSIKDNGEGAGEGFNINIPAPPGSGIGCYYALLERVILPALVAFNPHLILLSAGYDAAALDPLSHTMLNSSAYHHIVKRIVETAELEGSNAKGRVVAFHEGGYSAVYAPFCMLRAVEALVGVQVADSPVMDCYDDEIQHYSYQELQTHQGLVVAEAEALVEKLKTKLSK